MWQAQLALFLLCREPFFDRELCDAHTLVPPEVRHALCVASSARSFLLYHDLFSNRELFTDHELHDTHTLALPNMTHTLRVASSACSFSILQ